MTQLFQLLDDADSLVDERSSEVRALAERTRELAQQLIEASTRLRSYSIEARVGSTKASIGDNRFRYYKEDSPPPAESEYHSDDWRQLSEDEGRSKVEEWAGVSFDDLLIVWDGCQNGVDDLRRSVLTKLEPVARRADYSDGLAEIEKLRAAPSRYSAADYLNSTRPKRVLLDAHEVDLPRGTPLHLSNLAWATAASVTADRVEELLESLADLAERVRNEAAINMDEASEAVAQPANSGSLPDPPSETQPGNAGVALILGWIALGTAGLIAAFDAGWFGSSEQAPGYKAAAIAAVAAVAFALCREFLGWEGKRWGIVASLFVAVFSIAFAFLA